MRPVLKAAGIYNVLWGTAVILLWRPTARLAGFDPELMHYPQLWQCIGMIVGVYGVGYWYAASDAYRYWPVVLVGFLGKLFGPIGAVQGIVTGELPARILWTNLFNDLIWWVPFALILLGAARAEQVRRQRIGDGDTRHLQQVSADASHNPSDAAPHAVDDPAFDDTISVAADAPPAEGLESTFADATPAVLRSHVASGRTLVVFLRHAGCTFCREAVADLDTQAASLGELDVKLVLVLPGTTSRAMLLAGTQHLQDADLLHDRRGALADAAGLKQGGFAELFGPAVWQRGAKACLVEGHGVGRLDGNGFQMPGLVLYENGHVVARFEHEHAAVRPNYAAFVRGAESGGNASVEEQLPLTTVAAGSPSGAGR